MRLLLDTHALIHSLRQPQALGAAARAAIEDSGNEVFLSIMSAWELQIKASLGKLTLGKPVRQFVQAEVDRGSIQLLAVTLDHIDELSRLPSHHRDPFDRLLIAQALHDGLTIVTADANIARYPVATLWD